MTCIYYKKKVHGVLPWCCYGSIFCACLWGKWPTASFIDNWFSHWNILCVTHHWFCLCMSPRILRRSCSLCLHFFFSVWWGEWSLDSEGDNISDVRKVQPHMSGVDEGRLCEVRPIPHGLYSSRRRDHQPAIPPLHHHHSQHHGHWFMSVVIYSKVRKYYVFLSEVSFATIIARVIPRASGILWRWLSGVCDPT